MTASISGQAMAGVLVCGLKVAIKAGHGHFGQRRGEMLEGKIYFLIASAITALCAVLFVGAKRTKLIRHHFQSTRPELDRGYLSRYDSIAFHSKATEALIERKKLERQFLSEYQEGTRRSDKGRKQRASSEGVE